VHFLLNITLGGSILANFSSFETVHFSLSIILGGSTVANFTWFGDCAVFYLVEFWEVQL